MNVEIGRQNIITLFWKKRGHAVSFLGIHKSELDIYIGFSAALYLQSLGKNKGTLEKGILNCEDLQFLYYSLRTLLFY
jgi:hypothetical protein